MRIDVAQAIARMHSAITVQAQDFQIPKPKDASAPAPVKEVIDSILPPAFTGPSTTEIIVGAAVALAAAGLFLLLRGALFNHLIEKRVPPGSARGASWAFYTFLTVTTWTAIVGFVVGMWSSIPFLAGGGTVAVATLIFFLVSYSGALRKAK
jgi:hypothetical protein